MGARDTEKPQSAIGLRPRDRRLAPSLDDVTYRPVSPPWGRQGIHIADDPANEGMASLYEVDRANVYYFSRTSALRFGVVCRTRTDWLRR